VWLIPENSPVRGDWLKLHRCHYAAAETWSHFEVLKLQVGSLKPDLVIDIELQSCNTYNVEAVKVKSYVREDLGTDYLKVVTDFSQQNPGQLKTRIAAALEMN
jgi:benzoyl-CoA reductase/2-hydroxyglutaryl-CoA dehydratase subunit BcrC/BadD/HgdB